MEILLVLIFISALFLVATVLFFARTVVSGEYDQADRTALLPLTEELEKKS